MGPLTIPARKPMQCSPRFSWLGGSFPHSGTGRVARRSDYFTPSCIPLPGFSGFPGGVCHPQLGGTVADPDFAAFPLDAAAEAGATFKNPGKFNRLDRMQTRNPVPRRFGLSPPVGLSPGDGCLGPGRTTRTKQPPINKVPAMTRKPVLKLPVTAFACPAPVPLRARFVRQASTTRPARDARAEIPA